MKKQYTNFLVAVKNIIEHGVIILFIGRFAARKISSSLRLSFITQIKMSNSSGCIPKYVSNDREAFIPISRHCLCEDHEQLFSFAHSRSLLICLYDRIEHRFLCEQLSNRRVMSKL